MRSQSTASLRHRLAERGIDRALWMLAPAALFTIALFIYPFLYGIGLTVQPTEGTRQERGGGIWSNYAAFCADPVVFVSTRMPPRLATPVACVHLRVARR